MFPIAEAEIKECSTFAVVYRLRTYKATFSAKGGKLSQDDFEGITVVVPKNATKTTFEFGLKVRLSGEIRAYTFILLMERTD